MSFVDLMGNDVWTEADIIRRTEAMIRAEFSAEAETILTRKVSGMALKTYQPTPQDLADMARYNEVARTAQLAGVKARADAALLAQVFPMEEAKRRLDRPALASTEDAPATEADLAQDEAERAAAQAVIDAASPEARALFDRRNPLPPAIEPEAQPQEQA